MARIVELVTTQSDRVTPETSLREVASRMLALKISSLIVVDEGAILGIITERDLLRVMRRRGSTEQAARDAMSSPVHTVSADTDFRQAYSQAACLGIRHVVVVDAAGLPLGIVSESGFRKHLGPDFFRQLNSADSLMERTVSCLSADALLDDALTAMEAVRGTCVVIVDNRRPLGVVTQRDIVRFFLDGESKRTLGAVMSRPAIAIPVDSPLTEAAQRMLAHDIRHLVVVDAEGRLAGLLSEHALMSPLKLALVDEILGEHRLLSVSHERMQEEAARTERYQRALLDNFPYLVWLKDTESRFLAVNRALALAHGRHSAEEVIGRTDFDLSSPELARHYRSDDAAVMASRQNKIVIEPIVVGGRVTWHETYKAPIVGDDGNLLGTVGFARDISEQRRADEAMQLRSAALADLIGGASLARVLDLIVLSVEAEMPGWQASILLADEPGRHYCLGAAPSLPTAYREAVDCWPIGIDEDASGHFVPLRRACVVENVFDDPDWIFFRELARQARFTACSSVPICGPDGLLLGAFLAHHESATRPSEEYLGLLTQASHLAALVIAHQRRSNELGRSLETFRGIFDSISQALFIQAEDGSFLDVNLGAETLSGFPRSILIGKTPEFLVLPGLTDMPGVVARTAAAFAGTPQTFEILGRNSGGRIFPLEVRLQNSCYFGRPVLLASAIEISERKNAELCREVEYDLAQALAAGMQRDEVLGTLLRAALRFPDLEAGCLHWRQSDGSYVLIVHDGLSERFVGEIGRLDACSPFALFAQRGGVICNCQPPTPHCAGENVIDGKVMQAEGLGCLVALPIALAGQAVACLSLGSRRASGILPSTLRALEALGSHFSRVLQQLAVQEEARQLQQNLGGLFDTLKDFIFVLDGDGIILHYNRAVAENLGYGPEALIGRSIATVYPKNTAGDVDVLSKIVVGGLMARQTPLLRAGGEQIPVEIRVTAGYWNGCPALISVAQDIGERMMAEERQQLAASVFENAHEGIMITDAQGTIVEVNSTFSELTGYGYEEAVGRKPDLLKSGHHEPAFYEEMWCKIRQEGFWRGEVWNRKKSGEIFVEQLTISTVRNRSGGIANFVGIFSDITLIKQHQQRLEYLAHFDALTKLPNRMLLGDRLQLAMAQTDRNGKMLAVCYLDLDNFKPINDQHGHSAGDFLLIEVAQRLKACMRAGDTVSRLGGDEFVLLIANLDDIHECDLAIARVFSALNQPFRISNHNIAISSSIGVTLYPHDGADADTLLRHADQAMYAAKQGGRNRHHLFDPENDRRTRVRREELARIRQGLSNGEFALYYQPKVNMRKGSVTGAEALIRWLHPKEGLLLPAHFLPTIVGSELEIDIGDWVIRSALDQLEAWHAEGIHLSISINISGEHLQHKGFSRRLAELLASHPNVKPGQLELEVLETAALEDMGNIAELFAECRELGVNFALDDFGTGYSSLTYFRRLPAHVLKIDQSFVRNMLDDTDDLAIVEGVIGLTQAFRRQVIAEGVETIEHGTLLLLLGCDIAQGFGIARPMPPAELPAWIERYRPDDSWGLATAFQWSREDLPMLIAEVDHQRWKKTLLAYLDDQSGARPKPPLDHHACRFGRWYHSPDSQRYATADSFSILESAHIRLHELGRQLLEASGGGDPAATTALRVAFEAQSKLLSEYIQQIQAEVLINLQTSKR